MKEKKDKRNAFKLNKMGSSAQNNRTDNVDPIAAAKRSRMAGTMPFKSDFHLLTKPVEKASKDSKIS